MAITIQKAKPGRAARGPGARPVTIERIEILRLGAIETLSLEPPAVDADSGQWIVLLGANGSGKTSVLRSIALAATDTSTAVSAIRTAETLVHLSDQPGFGSAAALTVGGHRLEIHATRRRGGPAVLMTERSLHTPDDREPDLFAFGSQRGDAIGGRDRDVPLEADRGVATLFSRDARLIHAETWLRREKLREAADGRFFGAVLSTVASILPRNETLALDDDAVVVIEPDGRRVPLAAMSDGYLSTIGWAIDLIARWADRYRDSGKLDESFAKDMPCVVLVDELDLHLHPKWQLDIIPRLRAAFPKTTFVVTTHNPLTLQGTRPGEVFVLQKDEATGQISITQRDVPPGTDANRLLTGDWFGLGSTLDESTLHKLDRHRELLITRRPEADPERRALEQELRVRLNGFADTSYERMALDVIAELHDEKMRQRKDITAEDRERVVREVRARLAALDEPTGTREPATGARESGPTYRPAKPPGKAPPKASRRPAGKPSPRKPTAKTKPAARTRRR
jgi:energy-coupling factor transporter ATP-binding protein EcfA2